MTEFTTWRSLVDGAEISVIPDGFASRSDDVPDDTISDIDRWYGLKILTKTDYPAIEGDISTETADAVEAAIFDTDDNKIATVDISNLSAGDIYEINIDDELNSDQEYYFVLGSPDGWTIGRNGNTDFPYTSENVDIIDGVASGGDDFDSPSFSTFDNEYAIKSVGNLTG